MFVRTALALTVTFLYGSLVKAQTLEEMVVSASRAEQRSFDAPAAIQSRGKQICTCFNVTDTEIDRHLGGCAGNEDERFASLQSSLKCGTHCGSCVPELRRIVRSVMPVNQAA